MGGVASELARVFAQGGSDAGNHLDTEEWSESEIYQHAALGACWDGEDHLVTIMEESLSGMYQTAEFEGQWLRHPSRVSSASVGRRLKQLLR